MLKGEGRGRANNGQGSVHLDTRCLGALYCELELGLSMGLKCLTKRYGCACQCKALWSVHALLSIWQCALFRSSAHCTVWFVIWGNRSSQIFIYAFFLSFLRFHLCLSLVVYLSVAYQGLAVRQVWLNLNYNPRKIQFLSSRVRVLPICRLVARLMKWCLMSSDVSWHIRDKLWPMPKHGSI